MQNVEGGGAVDLLSPALGATEPRPVVVALHGMDAQPGWVCHDFRKAFGPWPHLVCAQGDVRSGANRSWGSARGMRAAIQRALDKAAARWPAYLDERDRVLVTYSQSASMAPALFSDSTAPRFTAVLFFEGFSKRIGAYAPKLADHGVQRGVFFATQPGNRAAAERSSQALRKVGLQASAEYGGSLGHWFTAKTVPALKEVVPVLVDALPAWELYPGPPS